MKADWALSTVSATSRQTGVADDELRPALETLVTATGSVAKSQKEMKQALDISAASGKDLETVTKAMALAHTGQTARLEKLIPGLSKAAKKAAQADQATLGKVEADANTGNTGDKNIGLGLAYLGYEQYDKALDHLSKGVAKGGLRNESEAKLLLGIAQLKNGKKDDAVKSFKQVKGDANLERIAELWSLHAKQA